MILFRPESTIFDILCSIVPMPPEYTSYAAIAMAAGVFISLSMRGISRLVRGSIMFFIWVSIIYFGAIDAIPWYVRLPVIACGICVSIMDVFSPLWEENPAPVIENPHGSVGRVVIKYKESIKVKCEYCGNPSDMPVKDIKPGQGCRSCGAIYNVKDGNLVVEKVPIGYDVVDEP